ncbi:hypothetical protein [Pseudothauera rhizosphaerae]|uniref:Uncharacterized protein n=1 Tax=Pseudothauera rhizosphaerae TaxID=2565932 RepID=A0A4S4AAK0_9RHOO|nr:hypothetical protein [Pseudothauera rhizosphaerae]THF55902.1 hypothetical protein E6O51_20160 [Pseudothauera rhizosphaerae]
MHKTILAFFLALPVVVQAANYGTCLLDKLPGTANDVAANAIVQVCLAENPGGIQAVAQGSGRGWFSHKSGAECTAKLAADTRSNRAAALIRQACVKLYDEPNFFDQFDPPAQPAR